MDSNRCSDSLPEELQALAADVDALAAQDLDRLADAALAEEFLALRRLVDRLEGRCFIGRVSRPRSTWSWVVTAR